MGAGVAIGEDCGRGQSQDTCPQEEGVARPETGQTLTHFPGGLGISDLPIPTPTGAGAGSTVQPAGWGSRLRTVSQTSCS